MKHVSIPVLLALALAAVACGGGGAAKSPDPGRPDIAVVDPGPGADVPSFPDEGEVSGPEDATDPGIDAPGDDALDAHDPGGPGDLPIPDAPDAGPECEIDADCQGKTATPGPCQAVRCSSGLCKLGPADPGSPCDDSNVCTESDACQDGSCIGTTVVCDDPPADECLDSDRLLDWSSPGTCYVTIGECVYASAQVSCPAGCLGGACLDVEKGLVQADMTPWGAIGLEGGKYRMSCVAQPWVVEGWTSSETYTLRAGFEP